MQKPQQSIDFKTSLIVLVVLAALALCLFAAIKLLSLNAGADINDTTNETLFLRAIDGDTLELSSGEVIRLLCVDTPEEGQAGYEEAKGFLSSVILSLSGEESLRIERQGTDMYNRTLAWVYSGETFVNKEIITRGYGRLFEYNGTECGRVK